MKIRDEGSHFSNEHLKRKYKEPVLASTRSKRQHFEKTFGTNFITAFITEDDPKTYEEAMKSIDATF